MSNWLDFGIADGLMLILPILYELYKVFYYESYMVSWEYTWNLKAARDHLTIFNKVLY